VLRTRLGNRTLNPAWFDMARRFPPPGAFWYGQAFRMGDRAAAYLWLADWRHKNPARKLTVYEDSMRPGTEASRYLPGTWLFDGIADDLITVTKLEEQLPAPEGQRLYHVTMWRIWLWLMKHRTVDPKIQPTPDATARANELLDKYKVPRPFAVVSPLFDAGYDTYRNQSPQWWHTVCFKLGCAVPTVIVGTKESAERMGTPDGVYPLWHENLNPMKSLAIINQANVYVGGATGMTLWAAIFKTPTLACYKVWAPHPGKKTDTRPISCGAPVVFCALSNAPEQAAFVAQHMFQGALKESTPL